MVTVKAGEEHFARISAILEKHHPIDLDQRTATMAPRTAMKDDGKIQLAAETMTVGKRAVQGGTTRIRRYVVETPVEQQVSLHSEKVMVDRHPVKDGQPVGEFTDKTIEMASTDEEAVVSKTARVKEEISLRKEGSDRTQTVKDTVRHQEIEVEQVAASQDAKAAAATATPRTQGSPFSSTR